MKVSVDIWAQGFAHDPNDELLSKSFELDASEECANCDYVTVCWECWMSHGLPLWERFIMHLTRKEV